MQRIYQISASDLEEVINSTVDKVLATKIPQKNLSQSVDEYARENGITPQTVKSHLRTGIIKGFKIGKFWRVEITTSNQ